MDLVKSMLLLGKEIQLLLRSNLCASSLPLKLNALLQLMKVETEAMYKSLKDEVKLTSHMCHERIVRLLGACLTDKNRICLIMELVENGNLSKRIHNRKIRKMEYFQILQVASQSIKEVFRTLLFCGRLDWTLLRDWTTCIQRSFIEILSHRTSCSTQTTERRLQILEYQDSR